VLSRLRSSAQYHFIEWTRFFSLGLTEAPDYFELAVCGRDTFHFRSKTFCLAAQVVYLRSGCISVALRHGCPPWSHSARFALASRILRVEEFQISYLWNLGYPLSAAGLRGLSTRHCRESNPISPHNLFALTRYSRWRFPRHPILGWCYP